jgi:hypothetical protein
MKKVKSILFLIPVLAGMMLTSCQSGAEKSLYQVVPANTSALFSVRVDQLVEKAGVAELVLPLLEGLSMDEAQSQVLALLKDKRALGLDLTEVLVFMQSGGEPACVLRVEDRAKFVKFLNLLTKEGMLSEVTKEGGFSHATLDDVLLTFDDHTALILPSSGKGAKTKSVALLTQSKEKSLLGNDAFAQTLTPDEEFFMYMNMGEIMQLAPKEAMLFLPGGMDLSKLSAVSKISFPDGAARMIALPVSYDPAMLNAEANRPLTRSLLEYFPASMMGTMIVNMKGEAYYETIEKTLSNMRMAMNMILPDAPLEQVFELFKSMGSIDGECMFGVVSGLPIPAVLLYAEVKDNRLVEMLDRYIPELVPVKKLDANSSRVDIKGSPVSIYYGIRNGLFFLTTDESLYKSAGQKVENSFKDSPLARRIPAGTTGYFLVDLAATIQPINVLSVLSGHGSISPEVMKPLSRLQYLESFSENDGMTFVIQLELKDKTQNVLKLITEAIAKQF